MPRTRPPYAPEFRRQIVELVRAGRTPEELSRCELIERRRFGNRMEAKMAVFRFIESWYKGLRGKVRRLVKDLDLDGWAKQVPVAVEQYAVIHYGKP